MNWQAGTLLVYSLGSQSSISCLRGIPTNRFSCYCGVCCPAELSVGQSARRIAGGLRGRETGSQAQRAARYWFTSVIARQSCGTTMTDDETGWMWIDTISPQIAIVGHFAVLLLLPYQPLIVYDLVPRIWWTMPMGCEWNKGMCCWSLSVRWSSLFHVNTINRGKLQKQTKFFKSAAWLLHLQAGLVVTGVTGEFGKGMKRRQYAI